MTVHEFADYTSDPAKYEKFWQSKVEAYNKNLKDNTIAEYLAPEELIPKEGWFDASKIPAQVLTAKELEITESSAVNLVNKMSTGALTAVETFTAFAKRATIAHQLTNCVMQFFIDEGLERAKELDEIFSKTGKIVGPLHGVPMSVKEQIGFKDKITHGSLVAYLDNILNEDAITIQLLKNAGAVFYARTTEPQCTMAIDSEQNITGYTRNARNTSLGPGGSSSGEGALIAMGGSSIGVGTDSGGSIRAPSAFNGVWGFKPTSYRIPLRGTVSAFGVQETIPCSQGPITRFGEDIELFMKAFLDQNPWEVDSSVIPLPWRSVEKPKAADLTIAICFDDGIVRPHPPIARGLKYVEEKLKKAGVNVVEWTPHKIDVINKTVGLTFTADGNFKQKQALAASGEPVLTMTAKAFRMGNSDQGISVHENHNIAGAREMLRAEYFAIMNEKKVDFIITPAHVGVAPRPNTAHYGNYLSIWNLLDLPGLVFPTGLVQDPSIDVKDPNFTSRNEAEEYEHGLYEPEYFENAPIGFQMIGRRYQDEQLVAAALVCHEIITE